MNHLELFCPSLIAAAAISLLISGCTAVGIVSGSLMDGRDPKKFPTKGKVEIEKGTQVEVATFQGDTTRGIFKDTVTLPFISCKESFEKAQRTLPEILRDNDTVRITLDTGKKYKGTLFGFEPEAVKFNLMSFGEVHPQDVPIKMIKSIESSTGEGVPGDTLSSWIQQGLIPSRLGLIIEHDSTRVTIPRLSVKSITEIKSSSHNWLYLGLAGLCIDAIVVLSAVHATLSHIGSFN
jgi:hypothetical protein